MNELPIYLMHDQPTTCPECGRRTEWIGGSPQHHKCSCGSEFLVEEDENFGIIL
jgi:tRNA(Ile2) C34 agmatinyltransferase TiaS